MLQRLLMSISNLIFSFFLKFPFLVLSKGVGYHRLIKTSKQPVLVITGRDKRGTVDFGIGVKIGNYRSPGFFSYSYIDVRNGSTGIYIKDNTLIGNRFVAISTSLIEIGADCLIGNDVKIYDSDFHSLKKDRSSLESKNSDVIIGSNVFIGDNVIILKGVSIGDRAVIGAGSVVVKNVGVNEIHAGNPAKKIGFIDEC